MTVISSRPPRSHIRRVDTCEGEAEVRFVVHINTTQPFEGYDLKAIGYLFCAGGEIYENLFRKGLLSQNSQSHSDVRVSISGSNSTEGWLEITAVCTWREIMLAAE